MSARTPWLCAFVVLVAHIGTAQPSLLFPPKAEAGAAFSIPTSGSGEATLYIVGPGDALQRKVQLGDKISFGADELHNAGHYVVILVAGSSSQSAQFDVVASRQPASLSFLAKPSRLAVSRENGSTCRTTATALRSTGLFAAILASVVVRKYGATGERSGARAEATANGPRCHGPSAR